jgi:isopentenyl diphosphate isomerase/L-lactate dehydrogenase-like FMN-dependent dehydrogenase
MQWTGRHGRTSTSRIADRITSVSDALYFARRRLPASIMHQFENGAGSLITHDANVRALEGAMFRPRHAVWTENRDQSAVVLGHRLRTPLVTSSIAFLGLAHPDGEAGVARAIGEAGGMLFVSGGTSTSIEKIMAAASGPVYFQPYFTGREREGMAAAIERARRAGADGLVLCIDSGIGHTPPRQLPVRVRRRLPEKVSLADTLRFLPQLATSTGWALDFARRRLALGLPMALDAEGREMSAQEAKTRFSERWIAWEDLEWIREVWDCPLIVKGVLSAEEARRAVDAGAAAVVVSNHGGNRLDGTVPSLPALPEVVAAVGGELDVLFDSGIRTGPDVVKAIALGAKAVGLGRAYLYPLAAAGEAGVAKILEIFRRDIDRTLSFLGCESLSEVGPEHVLRPPGTYL